MLTRRRVIVVACALAGGAAAWLLCRKGNRVEDDPGHAAFVIEPHRGIGPVSFGMTRAEVAAAMGSVGGGAPDPRSPQTDCFFRGSFQVSFGDGGHADFVEVSSDLPVPALLFGRDVRDTPADELLAIIRRTEAPDEELSSPESYTFSRQILTLYSPETQYDSLGGRRRAVFAAVGVGGETYLAAARAIRRG